MEIDKLWELYRASIRRAYELDKKYKVEKEQEKDYSYFTFLELNDERGKMNGIMRCIEALSDDKHEIWRRGFEIYKEENEFPSEGEFGCWMPCKKKIQPDAAGFPALVTAVNKLGQSVVFEAFTGYGEPGNPWYTLDRTKGDEKQKMLDCWTVTAWMPLPEPYKEDAEELENTDRTPSNQESQN